MTIVLKKTSYENAKAGFAWTNVQRPSGRYFSAYGYGNFFADGKTGLFTATLTYDRSKTLSDASGSLFEFWSLNENRWEKRDSVFTDNFSSSIHPRKALVADFNGDTIPDIFVVSHGYDSSPFPGERNKIVLSQGNGKFSVRDTSHDVDFFHGGSAVDVDQDGDVDVVAVAGGTGLEGIYTFLNDGSGSFTKDTSSRYPAFLKKRNLYYSIEFIDVNNDGLADLFLGGHEWEGAQTLLFLNPGNFDFSRAKPIYIPSVPNEGVVLDFLVTDSSNGKDIWILRTSGGDGTFYQSTVLQKFSLPSLSSEIVYNERNGAWTPWIFSDSKKGRRSVTSADGKNLFEFEDKIASIGSNNDIMNLIYFSPNINNILTNWNIYRVNNLVSLSDMVSQWFGTAATATQQIQDISDTKLMDVVASTWSDKVKINRVAKATDSGGRIEAKQIDFAAGEVAGSVISGGKGNDDIKGFAGWDNLEGGEGNDLIHGGNGRDIISGGAGRDELHGDFGWNTYKNERDGVSDLIAIKSDHYLVNWLYGKAGNSPNGEKSDIIEGLDPVDKIKIIGVDTSEITFAADVATKGVTGIGIYGKGIIETLYTGNDLTVAQITQMTSGDASAAAMSNSVNSYGTW